jgi:predicted nucleotidyltransferase component of viral defense system
VGNGGRRLIDKREILDLATQTLLTPHVIEKDYVLGWIRAGIYPHEELADSWIFKGGTCLKKCCLEAYQFSADLDFALRTETPWRTRSRRWSGRLPASQCTLGVVE